MHLSFKPYEIDHHTLKWIVGIIALSLASLTEFFSLNQITSISAAYHEGGMARDIFTGSLFALFSFLLAYNGSSVQEMILSKIAAFSALGVALFPCGCGVMDVPPIHYISAVIMFVVLALFCVIFYRRARSKHRRQADWRSYIYAISGSVIVLVIIVLGADVLAGGIISAEVNRLTFYGERAGLVAFGISWLTASQVLPFITAADERCSILPVKLTSKSTDS